MRLFEPEDFLAKDTDFPGSSQDELYLYNAEDFEMSLEDDQILYNLVEVFEKTLQRAEDFPGDEQDEQYLYEEVGKEDDAWTLCCLNHGKFVSSSKYALLFLIKAYCWMEPFYWKKAIRNQTRLKGRCRNPSLS